LHFGAAEILLISVVQQYFNDAIDFNHAKIEHQQPQYRNKNVARLSSLAICGDY